MFSNGTMAMNAEVKEGDVFWVPRYFPFCQIASRIEPFEFFGFTTLAHKNYPQFLVGANSILQAMAGPEVAAAFDASEERYRHLIDAQRESVILPSASTAPQYEPEEGEEGEVGGKTKNSNSNNNNFERLSKVIKNFGNDLIMGFD